jgi:hypothetical protein
MCALAECERRTPVESEERPCSHQLDELDCVVQETGINEDESFDEDATCGRFCLNDVNYKPDDRGICRLIICQEN